MDDRLTKTDLRVLGAILSFRNKNTNLCWPKREQISERCLLSLPKISTATTHLSSLGWLVKEGSGGCSRSSHYKLTVPDLITVPNSGTVPESGTVPNSGTKTVPESGTRIKQTNKQTISKYIEKDAVVKKMTTKQLLASYLITDDLADDFITHRKALKTTITKTVLNGYVRESDKAGIPLSEAITISIERGWRGFNAGWAWQTQKNQHTSHSNTGPLKTLGTNYAANNSNYQESRTNHNKRVGADISSRHATAIAAALADGTF